MTQSDRRPQMSVYRSFGTAGWPVALALGALGVGFALGRSDAPISTASGATPEMHSVMAQAPGDPREVIPLTPGPGNQPGLGPPQPRPAPGEGECTVLMFRDGQFYRIQPGTPAPDGTTPNGPPPNGDGELFPLQPPQAPTPDAPPFPAPEMRS